MSFSKIGSWIGLFSFCLSAIGSFTVAIAQENDFASLKANWLEIEQQLSDKEKSIAEGELSTDEEFRDLVDQANSLIEQLRTSGVESLKQDPNDRDVIRTLMGIMVNDAHFGRDKIVLQTGDELIGVGINPRYFEVAAETDRLSISGREIFEELGIRRQEAIKDDLPRVKLTTSKGDIELELFENEAPNTVANFISLIEAGFYDDLVFHRVLEAFMAQTGCPDGDGSGGPGYTIPCECYSPNARRHFTGSLSMAKTPARDTGGSQFFVTFKRTDFLDGQHTVFGRIISGWDALDNLNRTHLLINNREQPIPDAEKDKILKAQITRKRDHDYEPKKVGEPDESSEAEKQPPVEPAKSNNDKNESNDADADSPESADNDNATEPESDKESGDESATEKDQESEGATDNKQAEGEEESGKGGSSETEPASEPQSENEGGV